MNNENEIFKISSSVTKVFECNHEEGDTRIIFHVLQQKTNVTVYSKDTGVFVLMVFAYAINCWCKLRAESESILGKLPNISRNWCCNKASPNSCSYRVWHYFFLYGVGKIKVLKNISMEKSNSSFQSQLVFQAKFPKKLKSLLKLFGREPETESERSERINR